MSGWCIKDNPYPYNYDELPERLTLYRTDHSERMTYVPERTCTRKHINGYDFCSVCGHNITGGWAIYCPHCGAKVEQGQGRLDI